MSSHPPVNLNSYAPLNSLIQPLFSKVWLSCCKSLRVFWHFVISFLSHFPVLHFLWRPLWEVESATVQVSPCLLLLQVSWDETSPSGQKFISDRCLQRLSPPRWNIFKFHWFLFHISSSVFNVILMGRDQSKSSSVTDVSNFSPRGTFSNSTFRISSSNPSFQNYIQNKCDYCLPFHSHISFLLAIVFCLLKAWRMIKNKVKIRLFILSRYFSFS